MSNISREFCLQMKRARQAAKVSQSELAHEIGCNQSAISMVENGDGTKLNDEAIEKIAKKFNLTLPKDSANNHQGTPVPTVRPLPVVSSYHGYCPNPQCPSNHAYQVEERVFYRPNREEADPVGGKFCVLCGERLERVCPNCGSPLHDGAVCTFCGEPYISV